MKSDLLKIIAAAALFGNTAVAYAEFPNAGFEDGTTSGWTTLFDPAALTVHSTGGSGSLPPTGTDDWGGAPAQSGSFMGMLTSGGVELNFSVTGSDPQTLAPLYLWLNFISEESNYDLPPSPYNDKVIATFTGSYGSQTHELSYNADATNQGPTHALYASGWRSFLMPAGTSLLQVSVQNIGDTGYDSYSLIDVTAIPEPESYAMIIAGLGLLGFVARRRRNSLKVA